MSADKLRSLVVVTNLAPGASIDLAHGLIHNAVHLVPDEIWMSNPSLECTASTTLTVTITNRGASNASGLGMCEAWHPDSRLFGHTHQDGSFHDRLQVAVFSAVASLIEVAHDGTRAGSGTAADPLSVVGGGVGLIDFFAAASLNSTTGLYTAQSGFVGNPVKNGVGDWTLQYSFAFDTDLGFCSATVQDQGGAGQRENITVQSVDNTHVRVRTFQAGAAKDQHFWIALGRIV